MPHQRAALSLQVGDQLQDEVGDMARRCATDMRALPHLKSLDMSRCQMRAEDAAVFVESLGRVEKVSVTLNEPPSFWEGRDTAMPESLTQSCLLYTSDAADE